MSGNLNEVAGTWVSSFLFEIAEDRDKEGQRTDACRTRVENRCLWYRSMDAKNIKVITRNAKVTLRGPVKTAAELAKINVMVKAMPGIKSIDNQLQVK